MPYCTTLELNCTKLHQNAPIFLLVLGVHVCQLIGGQISQGYLHALFCYEEKCQKASKKCHFAQLCTTLVLKCTKMHQHVPIFLQVSGVYVCQLILGQISVGYFQALFCNGEKRPKCHFAPLCTTLVL